MNFDIEMMAHPERWPHKWYLPMVRVLKPEQSKIDGDHGCLLKVRGDQEKSSLQLLVKCNMYELVQVAPAGQDEFDKFIEERSIRYASLQAIWADGWRVD